MDTRNLHTFKTVAHLQSVSKAADKLHLTQPAVSKRIQQLEAQLDTHLFDRIGHTLILTEAGACLLPFADKVLQLLAEGRQALEDLNTEVKGELHVVTSHHIGLHRLPGILQNFRKRYPLVKMHLQFLDSAQAHQAILSGQAHIGVTTEVALPDARISVSVIWDDTLHFVVARQHPLARRARLKLADIAGYRAILPEQRFRTAQLVKQLFDRYGLELLQEEGMSTNYLETIKALLVIGDTWSVLPRSMLDKKHLATLNPTGIQLSRQLVYIRHKDRSLNRASKAFIELLDAEKRRSETGWQS